MSEGIFDEEFKMVEEFTKAVMPLITSIEAQQMAIEKLKEQHNELSKEIIKTNYIESQQNCLGYTIQTLESDNRAKLDKLKEIKEEYIAEDIINIFEIITSADEGLEISEAACDLMKKINDLIRNAEAGQN